MKKIILILVFCSSSSSFKHKQLLISKQLFNNARNKIKIKLHLNTYSF